MTDNRNTNAEDAIPNSGNPFRPANILSYGTSHDAGLPEPQDTGEELRSQREDKPDSGTFLWGTKLRRNFKERYSDSRQDEFTSIDFAHRDILINPDIYKRLRNVLEHRHVPCTQTDLSVLLIPRRLIVALFMEPDLN